MSKDSFSPSTPQRITISSDQFLNSDDNNISYKYKVPNTVFFNKKTLFNTPIQINQSIVNTMPANKYEKGIYTPIVNKYRSNYVTTPISKLESDSENGIFEIEEDENYDLCSAYEDGEIRSEQQLKNLINDYEVREKQYLEVFNQKIDILSEKFGISKERVRSPEDIEKVLDLIINCKVEKMNGNSMASFICRIDQLQRALIHDKELLLSSIKKK